MQWFQLRPTFEIAIAGDRDSAIERLNAEFQATNRPDRFFMHGEYGELHLPPEEHRLWSPHLSFYLVQRDEKCGLFGRYAPRLNVWTTVWIVYLAMAFTVFFALILAYSQWMLGSHPWGLWLALFAVVALLSLYVVAHIGQQWSVDQMHRLRQDLEDLLERCRVAQK